MDTLDLMVRLMDIMVNKNYPVVFKGAMVLTKIIEEKEYNVFRNTEDIDLDWENYNISMDELTLMVEDAVKELDDGLYVEVVRNFGENTSAGFDIRRRDYDYDAYLFSIDVSIRYNNYYDVYESYYGVQFRGASLEKMCVDKISSISSDRIFRRIKDIYDMYVISHLEDFSIYKLNEILEGSGRYVYDFNVFLNSYDDLEYGYNKLRGIVNKPDFEIVYPRVRDFCMPYITDCYKTGRKAVWYCDQGVWY